MNDDENQPVEQPDNEPGIEMILGALMSGDLADKLTDDDATIINGDDIPDELKDVLMKFVSRAAEKEVQKRIAKAEIKLDQFADDFRQALTTDDEGPGMEPYQAMATLGHHLGEHDDIPRSALAIMFGVAIGKVVRLESQVMDLELQLAGHQTAA